MLAERAKIRVPHDDVIKDFDFQKLSGANHVASDPEVGIGIKAANSVDMKRTHLAGTLLLALLGLSMSLLAQQSGVGQKPSASEDEDAVLLKARILEALKKGTVGDVRVLSVNTYLKTAPSDVGGVPKKTVLSINAQDNSPNPGDGVNAFKAAVSRNLGLQRVLGKMESVRLKDLSAPDLSSDGIPRVLFTLECEYSEDGLEPIKGDPYFTPLEDNQSEAHVKRFEETKAKAQKGDAEAQCALGAYYSVGDGVTKDAIEAVKWWRKAADQGVAYAQQWLAAYYYFGAVAVVRNAADPQTWDYQFSAGTARDRVEAVEWLRKIAGQGDGEDRKQSGCRNAAHERETLLPAREAQMLLGTCYEYGSGVTRDIAEAVRLYRLAADQAQAGAQYNLGACYWRGDGVPKDYVKAYTWINLASAQGIREAKRSLSVLEKQMTSDQVAEGQRLASEFKPKRAPESGKPIFREGITGSSPSASGTGFFITEEGFLVTNEHVIKDATQVRLVTSAGLISARVVKVDVANDLALLKAEGRFAPVPIVSSRTVHMGNTVATVGFPNIDLQGFAPKLAKGEIAALSGARDDPRYFQISVPVQPGNSGGALVDERGNLVGVVSAKLDAVAALSASGALPENVNYAVKSSLLLSFLESVPEVSAKLKKPSTAERKSEDVVKSTEQAAVLVLVY